jgi:hypothetical protein
VTTTGKPRAPRLGTAGKRLWRSVTSVYELSPPEVEILRQAARTADLIEWLDAQLQGEPMTVPGSMGQARPNPLLTSVAEQRKTLESLIRSLALPMPGEDEGRIRSPSQAQNANARWRPVRAAP